MLTEFEINQLKINAKIHKVIFKEIKKNIKPGLEIYKIDKLCEEISNKHNVLCGFKGVYDFPYNICISINNVVVHGRPMKGVFIKSGDLVTFDFGIKDKKYGVYTDSAFSVIIGGDKRNPIGAKLIETNKKALYAGIKMAKVGNSIGDISYAIQKEIENAGFKVVKDLTGHSIGKKLHEKPYIPNYGKPGTGIKLIKGMVLAIEPIIGETSGEIIDKGNREVYIKDGSLGCQYEHTILITDGDAEIIV